MIPSHSSGIPLWLLSWLCSVGDVQRVADAVAVAVVVADPQVVDVLLAVEGRGPGEIGADPVGDHLVVVADLVLVRPADEAVPGRAELLVGRPGRAAVGRGGVEELADDSPRPVCRVSFQTTSIRPFGATDIVPNHCQAVVPGSSLMRTGALQVAPPFVLRMKCTSSGIRPRRVDRADDVEPAGGRTVGRIDRDPGLAEEARPDSGRRS